MKLMLLFLTALYVGGSHNQTVSPATQDDPKLAAIRDRISNASPQEREIVEKIKDLKPEINGQPSAMTLGATVKDCSERACMYPVIGWEASQKTNGRWKTILHYQRVQKQYLEAEWEYDPATSKLYPFELQNAPQFWSPGCQPLDSTDRDQLWGRLNECVRPEGAKRTRKPEPSPSGDRYVFVGEFWERHEAGQPPVPGTWTDLWIVNINGTGLQRLTTDGTSSEPEWSPDGNEIVFTDKGSIKVLDTRSKEVRTLLEAHSVSPDEGADSVVYNQPKWSPSGKAIAVVALGSRSGGRESIDQVEVITTNGSAVCRFANGAEHHQWNKKGELELDYGKFIFDWDGFIFSDKPQPEREVKPASDKADQLRKELLERVNDYGVERIAEYSLAPSGNRIVFAGEFEGNMAYGSGSRGDLWLVNRDGTGLRRLTENHYSSQPAWSPDGKEIAFVADLDSISIINVKTRRVRSLPGLQAYHPKAGERTHDNWDEPYLWPRWSPNGKIIAAEGVDLGGGFVTAVDARFGDRIFEVFEGTFSWSRDGELVIPGFGKFVFDWDRTFWYGSSRRNPEPEVSGQDSPAVKDPLLKQLLERLSSKGVKNITEYFPSPTGEKLVFAGEFEETHNAGIHDSDLWLANRDGSGLRRLTKNQGSSEPAWSPSGKQIAFVNVDSISVIDLPGRSIRRAAGLQAYHAKENEDHHATSGYGGPRWSPNGRAIAAQGGNGGTAWVAAVDARSGRQIFQSGSEIYRFAWNDDSELLFGYGDEGDVKVIFDWTAITSRARPSSDRRVLFKQDGKFGYLHSSGDGEKTIKPQFSDAGHFSEGLAPVAFDGKWGYINKTGELANIPRFDAALPFYRGMARVKIDGRWRLIDKRSLRDIGPAKSAIPTLIAALKDRDDSVRTYAAKTLAKMGRSALAALAEALKDENEIVRTAAAKIIGEIGSKAQPAIPALVTALKGEDQSASSNAAQALGKIGLPAVPSLIEALKDPRDYVRRNAARALWTLAANDEEAIDRDDVRRNRDRALGKLAATAVPALIEALKDSDAPVREAAAGALGSTRPQTSEAAHALIAALNDTDTATRGSVSQALVHVILYSSSDSPFEQTAVPALIVALRGEDKVARDAAVAVLYAAASSIGPREKEAVLALVDALKGSRNTLFRISAFQRLALLGREGKAALPAVIEALKDPDAGVRKAAADALAAIAP